MRAPAARRHGTATVFNDSPAAQAKAFAHAGCEWLHWSTSTARSRAIRSIARRGRASCRRSRCRPSSAAASAPSRASTPGSRPASSRVILGTVAVKEPELVKAAARAVARARSPSASTRATAWSRSTAGPAEHDARPRPRAALRGRRRRRHHLHRHRPRRRDGRRQCRRHGRRWPSAVTIAGHRLGRRRSLDDLAS